MPFPENDQDPHPLPTVHLPLNSPRQARSLHDIGEGHVIGPHIVLPLAQTQHPTEHTARVQAHTHVQVHLSGLGHRPVANMEREGS